jgi:hypothetical protein
MFADFMESSVLPSARAEVTGVIQVDVHVVQIGASGDGVFFDEPEEVVRLVGSVAFVKADRSVFWYGLSCDGVFYLCRDRWGQQISVLPGARIDVVGAPEFLGDHQMAAIADRLSVDLPSNSYVVTRHVSADAGYPLGGLWEITPERA